MGAKQGMMLALWQAESVAGDVTRGFAAIEHAAMAAGAAGAQVVVLPELFVTGYDRDDLADLAMAADEIAARLAPIARAAGCAICVGYPERVGPDLANAAICVGADGTMLANHRKIQLYGPDEAARFVAGDRYACFDLAGQKAAILICYDVEFAPHVAALRDLGVQLLLVPTAAMCPFEHVGAHVVPAMAANHAINIVYANLCGTERALEYFGGSVIVGADGKVLARAGSQPAMLMASLPSHYDAGLLSTQRRDFRPIPRGA